MRTITGWAVLVIIVCAFGFSSWPIHGQESRVRSELVHLQSIWGELTHRSPTIIMVHRSPYHAVDGLHQLQETGHRLSSLFGLPQAGSIRLTVGETPVYETSSDIADYGMLKLALALPKHHAAYLTLSVETARPVSIDLLAKLQNELNRQLQSTGIKPEWNVMYQSEVPESDKPSFEHMLKTAERVLDADTVDLYRDSGTASATMFSRKLPAYSSGSTRPMNVQLALQRDSHERLWRLTLGTPVITIEY